MALPPSVHIVEEGPREGFQGELPLPTSEKLRLIDALAQTGLTEINCASFVNQKRVPQMADAEDVARGITYRENIRFTGSWLNKAGFERARSTPLDLTPYVFAYASDEFAARNNNLTAEQNLRSQTTMIECYKESGMVVDTAYIFAAFGSEFGDADPRNCEGTIANLLDVCAASGASPKLVYLTDTVGFATPLLIRQILDKAMNRWPQLEFALHLHDTRGMGLANVVAALELGVRRFDSSVGGLGGCPFAGMKGASGNVCTEDLVLMCEEMGIATGIDLDALIECARLAEKIVGHPLPGKTMYAGRIRHATV